MSTKTLFVTGASSGIGGATARLAVAQGWHVGLFSRSEDQLNPLADELGDAATVVLGDVTDLDTVKAAMSE
jgi:NADP-dependent 3-hydroxy acid dehydrogenase YdfG